MTDKLEHPSAVQSLFENMNDCEGARGLFELYMELLCGKDVCDPAIIDTEQFRSLWNDYHPDELQDILVNEAPDARKNGDGFTPNTALYGRAIFVYDANNDNKDAPPLVGSLKEIKSPHTYLIEIDGENDVWEVDSVNDLEITEDGHLNLWNAWR